MSDIKLDTLKLVTFDQNNKEHILFLKKILNDKTVTQRFNGFLSHLKAKTDDIIGKGFFVKDKEIIGYIDIGDYNKDEEAVYLRGLIDKNKRGNNYGHIMLDEVTNYIFINYPIIKYIKLKIEDNNKASLKTALSVGYSWINSDYYGKLNPYYEYSNKDQKASKIS